MGITRKYNQQKKLKGIIGAVLALLIIGLMVFLFWYNYNLSPYNKDGSEKTVLIQPGATPIQIGNLLASEGVIRSALAFRLYTKFHGVQNSLQAGSYTLSAAYDVPQITDYLVKGKVDNMVITFLPGATLAQNKKVLLGAGFSEQEVNAALKKQYKSPLFAGKPASADLEGYIFGETYYFERNSTVEAILEATFDQFYKELVKNNLIKSYQDQGLSLYEAITLASIVQKEAIGGDEPEIAQVFLLRLKKDMPLGSDPTYQYIADKLGVKRSTTLDNPYNTRIYKGLPPGPIASPGIRALKAVANPAETDYLFFVHGDDDRPYFSHTYEEHEANVKKHCQKKCQLL